MIYAATSRIASELKSVGVKHQVREAGPLSFVEAGFSGDNQNCLLRAISTDNDNDVKILSGSIAKFSQAKLGNGFKLINSLNRKYKYAKFCIDDDGDLTVQCDVPSSVNSSEVGKITLELLLRCSKIIDDAYPEIMRTIWA